MTMLLFFYESSANKNSFKMVVGVEGEQVCTEISCL